MQITAPTWRHQDRLITAIADMPENTFGFIYEVKHIPTGIKYIGKKVLYFERNKRLGVRALEKLKEERKAAGIGGRVPAKEKVISESDWKTYYGSHPQIKQLLKETGPESFTRTILVFVPNKKLLTYYETKYLFINEVLENRDNYINDNVLGKFYRKDFYND